MPRFTETMKREINLAEAHYSNGIANQGKEIIDIAQARCMIQLIEVLVSIRNQLQAIEAGLQSGVNTRIEGISYPSGAASPESLREAQTEKGKPA